jgi:energy-coupling factor transport system permease protein
MDRIEVISNAMELRGFGKGKKRTWYMGRPFTGADFAAMLLCALLMCASIALNIHNGGRFWNPFRA